MNCCDLFFPCFKSFVTQKEPKNDVQFAAVVAYYTGLKRQRLKESITKDDLITACRLAGRDRPPVPQQTLRNALNASLLDSTGVGNFSINTVGENLVAVTLPGDVISGGSNEPAKLKAFILTSCGGMPRQVRFGQRGDFR